MAILRALDDLTSGNLSHAFSDLWVSEEELQRGEQLDSALDASIQDSYERGLISMDQYQQSAARLAAGRTTQYFDNPYLSPAAGFQQGLSDGYTNVTQGIKSTLAAPFQFTAASIPWQVWLLLGGVILWKTGLLARLFKR